MGSHFGNYPHETARAYRCASWLAVIPNVVWFSVGTLLLVVVASLPVLGSSRMNMQHSFNDLFLGYCASPPGPGGVGCLVFGC